MADKTSKRETEGDELKAPQVERQFKQELSLPKMALPDWQFVEQAVEVFRPYADSDLFGVDISVRDRRGEYSSRDVGAVRTEFETRGEEVKQLFIQGFGRRGEEGLGMFRIYVVREAKSDYHGFAEVTGSNEVLVSGVAARIKDIAERAAERFAKGAERSEPERLHVQVHTDQPIPTTDKTRVPWWNSSWTITIVGGVVVAVIVAVVFALVH